MIQNILIVEDEILIRILYKKIFCRHGEFIFFECDNGRDAIDIIQKNCIELILMDIKIKGNINGIETAQKINKYKDIPIVFLSAYDDYLDEIKKAVMKNFFGFYSKPITGKQIKEIINNF